jgi:hypothetical protein
MFPCEIQLLHELQPTDSEQRVDFCNWLMTVIDADANFLDNVFMSDEADFWLNGYVNSQNYRYWATDNPHATVEMTLY